jgi:hypothetical protein
MLSRACQWKVGASWSSYILSYFLDKQDLEEKNKSENDVMYYIALCRVLNSSRQV